MNEGHMKLFGDRPQIRMIADDQTDIRPQITAALPTEQIEQTMILLAHPDGKLRPLIGKMQRPGQPQFFCRVGKFRSDAIPRQTKAIEFPFEAGAKNIRLGIAMLIGKRVMAGEASSLPELEDELVAMAIALR